MHSWRSGWSFELSGAFLFVGQANTMNGPVKLLRRHRNRPLFPQPAKLSVVTMFNGYYDLALRMSFSKITESFSHAA